MMAWSGLLMPWRGFRVLCLVLVGVWGGGCSFRRPFGGVFLGSGERVGSIGGLAGRLVAAVCSQVSSGSARMRASALVKSCCHGQRAGR
jgi:hypothetical protein